MRGFSPTEFEERLTKARLLMQEKNLNGLIKEYNSKCISINQTVYINNIF